ncbi:MAG TPA: hypothetical protein VG898_03540 [Solirubrobacterales bacterium]|nr:hypothetical protein [Solirubrobacterales bacterium]
MAGELEKLAYEAAVRSLDKQEGLLEEMRSRTGVLLAASSLAASFLGQQAFHRPEPRLLAIIAMGAFCLSVAASIYILIPRRRLVFAQTGGDLYETLFPVRNDMDEVYRLLAYTLDCFWESNDTTIHRMAVGYHLGAGALVIEVASLVALLCGTLA